MDKKDIYEHLAKIYLDASLKKNEKKKEYPVFKTLFFFSLAVIFSLSTFIFSQFNKKSLKNSEIALVLQPDLAKINFNFDPAKKEIYSIKLNKLNLARYKALSFYAKNADYSSTVSLRVEFTNIFKEKSEIYCKYIPNTWKEYKINFSDFKNIRDWSEMSDLSFIVEQWNAKKNHGKLYIDNIAVLK